jgi:hypothetical protein
LVVVFIKDVWYIPAMMRCGKTVACLLSVFVGSTSARALATASPGSPYGGIVDRNVFALKPPPAPEPPKPPPAPPTKIILTGITTILGKKQALLKAQIPAKPGEPAREVSLILTEGQRDEEIEVIAIDEKANTVKVNNSGTIQTLNFEKDGPKLTSAPPGARPGSQSPGGVNSLRPNQGGPLRTIPTRSLRSPSSSSADGSQSQSGPAADDQASLQEPPAADAQAAVPSDQLTPEQISELSEDEKEVLIEEQRAQLLDLGDPAAMLLPPTKYTPEGEMPQMPPML